MGKLMILRCLRSITFLSSFVLIKFQEVKSGSNQTANTREYWWKFWENIYTLYSVQQKKGDGMNSAAKT